MDWGVGWSSEGLRNPLSSRPEVWVLLQPCIPTSPGHCSVDPVLWRNMLSCAQSQQTLRSSPGAKDLWNKIAPVPEQLKDCQSMIPSRTVAPACPCFSTTSLAGLHSSVRSKQLIENRISFFPILNHFIWPQFLIWTMYFGALAPLWFGKGFYWVLRVCAAVWEASGICWRKEHQPGQDPGELKAVATLQILTVSMQRKLQLLLCHLGRWWVQFLFGVPDNESSCPYMLCFSSNKTSRVDSYLGLLWPVIWGLLALELRYR